jgi:Family of unknown function (DUF5670)
VGKVLKFQPWGIVRINKEVQHIMIWTIIGILLILWLLGLIFKIGGAVIHVLLVIAIVVFIFNRITGRKKGL